MADSLNIVGMYAIVGESLSAFHTVETGLASCYGFAVANPGKGWDRAIASFFAADMFRSKLAMTNTAVRLLLRQEPELPTWTNLHNRVGNSADTRNKLAHGAAYLAHGSKGRSIELAGHMWDARWTLKETPPARPPTMQYAEVKAAKDKFTALGEELQAFAIRIQQIAAQP